MILSVAVISIMLGSLYNVTFAGKPSPQPNQVEVTNFPLDEEGNLRTATTQSSEIMLVFNKSLTAPSNASTFTYITSFNTSGFRYYYIMAQAQAGSFEVGISTLRIYVYENNFGVQTPAPSNAYFYIDTGIVTTKPSHGAGKFGKYEFHSTWIDLYLNVYNSDVGFDGLLTIVVHLSN